MNLTAEKLARYLALAEKAHKAQETQGETSSWQQFYAEWLLNNTQLGGRKPKREWDFSTFNSLDKLALFTVACLILVSFSLWATS